MPTGNSYTVPHDWVTSSPLAADRLQRLAEDVHALYRNTQTGSVAATSALTLTTSNQDVPSASVSITLADAATRLVVAVFDFDVSVSGVGVCVGDVFVDGAALPSEALFAAATTGRLTASVVNIVSLAAGTHTIKMQARKTVASGTATVSASHTRLVVF